MTALTPADVDGLTLEQLDELIAVRVMGESRPVYTHIHTDLMNARWSSGKCWYCLPEYDKGDVCEWKPVRFSHSIEAAFEVVEKITRSLEELIAAGNNHPYWTLDRLGYDCCKDGEHDIDGMHGQWRCWFARTVSDDERIDVFATGDTAPVAICRAALKAVLAQEQDTQ